MQQYFYDLADELTKALRKDEVLLTSMSGEESDFVRFNRSAVRQAGSVRQNYLTAELIVGRRHAAATFSLTGEPETDRQEAQRTLGRLRDWLPCVPEDPYLLYATEVRSGQKIGPNSLPDSGAVVDAVLKAGAGRDLVGIYAAGGVFQGFANSLGQRNWFSSHSFHLDWSFYLRADKAVKTEYADFQWDPAVLDRKVASAAEQLAVLDRPPKTIPRGQYRVFLAPAALRDYLGTVAWSGFGLKSHRTKTTCLLRMIETGAALHPSLTLRDNTREGIAPNFQSGGYIKPDAVTLIEGGRFRNCLVSPRSAKEYGLGERDVTGGEHPESLDMAGGDVPIREAARRLGTGVYVNQFWYLNYSDLPACRITGMTRFATFWVEDGRIQAPLNVMRFDETVYRVLGENLLHLTVERDFLPSSSTYGGRSTTSTRLPGALVDKFAFTL
jgi:predicted Zn-dependent protease